MLPEAPPAKAALSATSRTRLRAFVVLTLELACIAYIARVLWNERTALGGVLDLEPSVLFGLFALMGIAHLQRTYEFTYMLRRLGVRESFRDGFLLTGAGFLLNHLPFNAGLVMRATVLKRDHALSYTAYVALVTVNALVNVSMAAVLGFTTVALREPFHAAAALPLLGVFAAMLAGAALLLSVRPSWVPEGDGFVARKLRSFSQGADSVRGNARQLAWLACLASAKIVVAGVRMWICFGALGQDVSILGAGLLASTAIVFSLINITPGNLGLRELALAAIATQLGSSYAVGMAAASVDRVVLLVYTVMAGVPGLWALKKRGPFRP